MGFDLLIICILLSFYVLHDFFYKCGTNSLIIIFYELRKVLFYFFPAIVSFSDHIWSLVSLSITHKMINNYLPTRLSPISIKLTIVFPSIISTTKNFTS